LRGSSGRSAFHDILTSLLKSRAVYIVFDAVMRSGGAPTNALIWASRDASTHSSHRNPAVAPGSIFGSVNARLSELSDKFAQPKESLNVDRSGPLHHTLRTVRALTRGESFCCLAISCCRA
jgi:hypothetical protein